jgi:hypothetical protein
MESSWQASAIGLPGIGAPGITESVQRREWNVGFLGSFCS